MTKVKRFNKKVKNILFDHPILSGFLENTWHTIITIASAICFTFGVRVFMQPTGVDSNVLLLKSCGASGLSQFLVRLCYLFGIIDVSAATYDIMFWIFYFVLNLPLLIFAFIKVGKKFTIYSILNVGLATLIGILFREILPISDFLDSLAFEIKDDTLLRGICGGLCTGVAASLAYIIDSTAGGIDIIAFYIAEKKGTQIGKISGTINVFILILCCFVCCFNGGVVTNDDVLLSSGNYVSSLSIGKGFALFIYSLIYMVVSSFMVNVIDLTNKKCCVQVVTSNENLSQFVLANIPHGCTILKGEGAYSGEMRYILYMTVRVKESKDLIKIVKKADPKAFVNVFPLNQVYGNFFRKPIE